MSSPVRVPRPIHPILAIFTALATALALIPLTGVASADEHTFNRGIATACTAYAQDPPTERFADIDGRTHESAINCLAHWEIVRGQDADGQRVYDPSGTVTRGAMATFVAQMMMRTDFEFPARDDDDPDAFPDIDGNVHRTNINHLADAGVVAGRDDGNYHPHDVVRRDAMATFIASAIEAIVDEDDIAYDDEHDPAFPDTDGNAHESSINKLAAIGVVEGRADGTYGPRDVVNRGAMASFVARGADYLGFRGHWPVPFAIELDPTTAENPHNVRNRVQTQVVSQFTLGYFSADVRFEIYRDGELTHMTHQTSGLGGDTLLSYNAGAEQGDVDTIVACIVHPDDDPTATEEYCVDRDDGDLVPREDRRGESVETSWTAAESPGPAPSGEWANEVLTIDTDDNAFHGHVLPAADVDEPLYLFVYSETDTFQVGGHGEVTMEQWECAVTATSEGHDIRHVLRASYNVDPADDSMFDLSTPVDVGHCF